MTQISQMWDDRWVGDAVRAPYNASEWDDMFEDILGSDGDYGVLAGRYNELVGSIPGANQFRIATGAALVKGKWYRNDANVDFAPASAGLGNWRRDRIVLSSSWNAINDASRDPAIQEAQTIRLIRLINPAENVGPPATTQNDGVLWEIPLYTMEITDVAGGGVVTIYADEREFILSNINIVGRTRKFFVPCVGGENQTDGVDIVTNSSYGCSFPDLKYCWGVGFTQVPEDFVSDMLVTAVVVSMGAGVRNVHSSHTVSYGQCGELAFLHSDLTGFVTVPITFDQNNCIQQITLSSENVGDILHFTYVRDGLNVNDTIGNSVYLTGWIVEYTADM